jgi:hypothetical protein
MKTRHNKQQSLFVTHCFRATKRSDDNRLVSPSSQRRPIPVSVFSPAKVDSKRSAPALPLNFDESHSSLLYASRSSTTINSDDDFHRKLTATRINGSKTPTGFQINDYSFNSDKPDSTKKMNVFERLFRSNKKKT